MRGTALPTAGRFGFVASDQTGRPWITLIRASWRPLNGDQFKQYDTHVKGMAKECTAAQQLMQLCGVGETTATAIVAMVGNAREFDSGRQFAAWLGLVPGQYSSGGKTRLGRITKAGDAYLRSLLVLGARAVLNAARSKTDSLSRWAMALRERRGYWKAVVAIAAKNARMAWAVLRKGEQFKLPA
jgi:transposase